MKAYVTEAELGAGMNVKPITFQEINFVNSRGLGCKFIIDDSKVEIDVLEGDVVVDFRDDTDGPQCVTLWGPSWQIRRLAAALNDAADKCDYANADPWQVYHKAKAS